MKLGAIWISYINDIDGKRYRTREQNINLNRSLLDDIRGQDEKRFIFFNDGSQVSARNICREIILEPNTYTPKKQRGGRS
ncbi:hypothetical protein MYZ02_000836 [Salmonella enterica]|nr:hypothetical protein [Salmonella enterica]EJD8366741.1 hypothetical protein [Salmonella enterica]EJF3763500.1 hypothetical protein [Salmonella enterica]EJF3899475.1 hypothetical protein [Salmonella enterica]